MTYIIDAIRTPIGKRYGQYKKVLPEKFLAGLISELKKRHQLKDVQIEALICSNAFGTGGNMARYASLLDNANSTYYSSTIDAQCSGGLYSIVLGSKITTNDFVLAGGLESTSLPPTKKYHLQDPRYTEEGYQMAAFDPNGSQTLLEAAKNLAEKYEISKEDLSLWTSESYAKAKKNKDLLKEYIVGVGVDECIKEHIDPAKLQILGTDSLIDRTNTAAHADGAALILLSNSNIGAKAKIIESVTIAHNPDSAPEGVILATEAILKKSNLQIKDISCFEINESFAANCVAWTKVFKVSRSKINSLGGTMAYGHPFGATGAINLIHLLASLQKNEIGLVAVPGAGGQAVAMIIEKY